ncbi:MAG: hypothetical protein ACYSWZ_10590 [Planctomycetota bacterium]|jgi:hypothetical protein
MKMGKGFKRLTLVLSILAGPFFVFYLIATDNSADPPTPIGIFVGLLIFGILGFVVVWSLFFLIRWLNRGFDSIARQSNSTMNNKQKMDAHQQSTPQVLTRKQDIGSKKITKKVIIYRILGWILIVFGLIGYFVILNRHAQESAGRKTNVYDHYFASFAMWLLQLLGDFHHHTFLYACVAFGRLLGFLINPLFWAGLVLLQRADKNEYPDRKSRWSITIMLYGIIILMAIIATITYPVLVRLTQIVTPDKFD